MGGTATEQTDAVECVNITGAGPAVILCEHASHRIPDRYAGLGLSSDTRESHAAWDPGARALALLLSAALDAPLVASRVSRLVYDCNRPPEAEGAIRARSEIYDIPGNRDLTPADRAERVAGVYRPFCDAVDRVLAARKEARQRTALITVHSFTPVYFDTPRAVEIGILHDADSRMADAMLGHAHLLPHRRIERNQPYGPADGVTHSLKLHGEGNALPCVMLEIRNDLLADPAQVETMSAELLALLAPALALLEEEATRA